MIRIEGLRHRILDIPALSIPPGFSVIAGPSGSGKTTLLRLLAGLEEPREGIIHSCGRDPSRLDRGYVHEFPGRNGLFTLVSQEIASPLWFRHVPCDEVERRVRDVARSLGIGDLLSREVSTLSGGEQVLCALATALVPGPELLLLDEFDSHLDARTTALVGDRVRSAGVPVTVMCTQDMDIAATADTLVFLEGGRVKHAGVPSAVFSDLGGSCWYPPSWRCKEWNSSLTGSA